MRIAPVPVNEDLRLQDLHAHQILDDEFNKDFSDLVSLAAHIYGCPIATIMLLDKDKAILKGSHGMGDVSEMPRDLTFCNHAILDSKVFVISNTIADERFCDYPAVTDGLKIRFYAGMPITSSNGFNLGAVCVMDQKPRELDEDQKRLLEVISRQISRLLELKLRNKQLLESSRQRIAFEKEVTQTLIAENHHDRRVIARELHENIAQRLAAASFFMDAMSSDSADPMVAITKKHIRDVMDEVRELSYSIQPSTLESLNFKDSLEVMASQYEKRHQLKVKVQYKGKEEIDKVLSQSIFIVIAEAFDNARVHGKAAKLDLTVKVGERVSVSVKDDGEGLCLKDFRRGKGLNRAASLLGFHDGFLDIKTARAGGCTLQMTV